MVRSCSGSIQFLSSASRLIANGAGINPGSLLELWDYCGYVIMLMLPPLYLGTERGCASMELLISFLVTVMAGVVCHLICKWLDSDE